MKKFPTQGRKTFGSKENRVGREAGKTAFFVSILKHNSKRFMLYKPIIYLYRNF